jgi:hypothetical protein
MAKISRRRYTAAAIQAEVERLTNEHRSPAAIYRELERDERFADRLPTLRTVQNIARDFSPPDPSAAWSLADAEDGEPAAVLPVVAAITQYTEGRVRGVSRREAEWITRIREASPSVEPVTCWRLARLYFGRTERKESTAPLDSLLAFAPWASKAATDAYVEAIENEWVDSAPMLILAAPRSGAGEWAEAVCARTGIWGALTAQIQTREPTAHSDAPPVSVSRAAGC